MDKAVDWKLINSNPVVCDPPKRSTEETASWDIDTLRAALDMIEEIFFILQSTWRLFALCA